MTTYFAWNPLGERYDPLRHSRQDLQIFRLQIQEKEGTYPSATLLIKSPKESLEDKKEALISRNNTLLFRGVLLKSPLKISKDHLEIKLVAKPTNAEKKLQRICKRLKNDGPWDPLFVTAHNESHPREVLEARSELFYWSRTSGRVKASCLFKGSQSATLGKSIFYDSLRYNIAHSPLRAIHLHVTAEWIQECAGLHHIGHLIKFKFPEGIISTLTGDNFLKNWWPAGQMLGRSGYTIEKSALRKVSPPRTGTLQLYPPTSIKLWDAETPYHIKRTWFRVHELQISWQYKQKRRETVHITLSQELQALVPEQKTKTLKLRLQNIGSHRSIPEWRPNHHYSRNFQVIHKGEIHKCLNTHTSKIQFDINRWLNLAKKHVPTLTRPTFFNTDRGRQAVIHALEIAKSHLAYSARAIEIRIQAPFEKVEKLTCDHRLILKDPRLPNGKVTGKVKHVRLYQDGETGVTYGEVTIACSIGKARKEPVFKNSPNPYVAGNYMEEEYLLDLEHVFFSPSKIGFQAWEDQQPIHGLLQPETLSAEDMVETIEVINPPTHQNKELKSVQFTGKRSVLRKLRDMRTRLRIRLKDIRSTGVLTHHIHVPIKTPYSPPQQIDLKG